MRCPFLREAQVKSCCASPYKKMIVRTAEQSSSERCSGRDWITCPAAKQHCEEHPSVDRCPFLQESLVQYCSAVSSSKYIPYSEASLSRCGGESHSYCEVFLSVAGAEIHKSSPPNYHEGAEQNVNTFYSPNHMWMKVHVDGSCHLGIDGFLAGVLIEVEKLSFVTVKGTCFPTAVLTARGVDLQLTFPRRIQLTGVNSHLRARPAHITTHPYTLGWLFEGIKPGKQSEAPDFRNNAGLIDGTQAQRWMGRESKRLTDYVHNEILSVRSPEFTTMMDGGVFSEDLITHLTREEILRLFNEFFSPTHDLLFVQRTNKE
jgi:glycine cleavage system H lipoate-binding protein